MLETRDDQGRLHSFDDQPAQLLPSGQERWYRHGVLHRDGGPAIVHANGSTKWYQDGRRHRDGGLPAAEYASGLRKWHDHGRLVRVERPA